jgi:hypothetical protein
VRLDDLNLRPSEPSPGARTARRRATRRGRNTEYQWASNRTSTPSLFGRAVAFGAEEMLYSSSFGASCVGGHLQGGDAIWGCCMRDLLILCGIGILSAAAWTVTAGAQGQGSMPASQGQGGLGGPMRLVGGYMSHRGMFIPTPPQLERRSLLFFGEPETGPAPPGMPTGGLEAGVPEHLIADYPVVPAIHLLANAAEQDAALIPQPTAPGGATTHIAAETDQAGAATAQPNPTASPLSPRPPGAVGPGRPVSGWSGPGLPGPGRRVGPRG